MTLTLSSASSFMSLLISYRNAALSCIRLTSRKTWSTIGSPNLYHINKLQLYKGLSSIKTKTFHDQYLLSKSCKTQTKYFAEILCLIWWILNSIKCCQPTDQANWIGLWLIDRVRLNVPPTQYRSYGGQVFMGQMTQPTVSKHWRNTKPKIEQSTTIHLN